jgi:50S ribosomal subunit-associated GTPase HflX
MVRPQIVVFNKIDSVTKEQLDQLLHAFAKMKVKPMLISAATGQRIQDLIFAMGRAIFADQKEAH